MSSIGNLRNKLLTEGLKRRSSKTRPIDSDEEMGIRNIIKLSYEDLAGYTDNFSESNYLCYFAFGKVYRGKILCPQRTRYVMVKIWEPEDSQIYSYENGDNEGRLVDEVFLHRHEGMTNHPGIARLYGYCNEDGDHLGVVYDLNPFDSLFNLIPKDGFTWLQRIKVLLGLAYLLKFLHTPKCSYYKHIMIRNLDSAHIVLDEDYNPKLCDFGLISGGIFPDRTIFRYHHVIGSYGYMDIESALRCESSEKQDVHGFGVILLNMISKRVNNPENRRKSESPDVARWGWSQHTDYLVCEHESKLCEHKNELGRVQFSLVHESLKSDPDFEPEDEGKISMLFNDCTEKPSIRPSIKQVLRLLLKLKVVKNHADFLQVDKLRQASTSPI